MRISVYLPWLFAAALAIGTPQVAARLRPDRAAAALSVAAAVTAAASSWGLVLLTVSLLVHTPPLVERHAPEPVPLLVGLVAALVLTWASRRALRVVRSRRDSTAALHRICRLCPRAGDLAVTADAALYAFAVPHQPSRSGVPSSGSQILVSRGLLRSATPEQRRVVLAHERAHLRHRHHRLRAATDLAAAVNPLLSRTRDAVAYLVERAADEAAARTVGSRTLAAHALADIALSTHERGADGLLAFHRHAVLERVQALQRPPVRSTVTLGLLCLFAAGLTAGTAADATLALARVAAQVTGI